MQQINELINFFKNITQEQIVDILIAVIVITLFCIFSSTLSYLIIKIFMRKEKDKQKIKSNAFYLPLRTLFIFVGIHIGICLIQLPTDIMEIWRKILKIVIICIVAKGLVNLVDPKSEIAKKIGRKDRSNQEKTVANFTGRILKYIIYLFAAFCILMVFNYDVSGLVAGLGISGAIVALAAQDFVKSLISGFSILADKPFLVGDWIEVGIYQGTVTDISFRCTKIKTSDNSVITIQNSALTASSIINWSRMKQRRYILNLKLPLETNADSIETIVNRIRFVLQTNEEIVPETIQVHFDSIMIDGVNINIYMYTNIIDYIQFLEFKQTVNEQILKVLESENIKLAYPGQNIYLMENKQASCMAEKIEENSKPKSNIS